jgi:hypothetical protein
MRQLLPELRIPSDLKSSRSRARVISGCDRISEQLWPQDPDFRDEITFEHITTDLGRDEVQKRMRLSIGFRRITWMVVPSTTMTI